MAIQFRAASTPVNDASTPATITKPAGVVSGDMLLLHVGINLDETPTPPAGFTLIANTTQTGLFNIRVYAKVAGGSEPASYDVPFTGGGTCGLGMVAWYSDNGHTLAVDTAASQNNTGTTRQWPTVTAAQTGEALTCFASIGVNASSTPDAAMTERYDAESAVRMYCMTQVLVSAGATGTRDATTAGSGTSRCASVLVLEVLTPPTAPSLLTATAVSPYRIDLEWQDNSSNETGFEIDVSTNGTVWSALTTTAANVETYSHTGLSPGTLRYYRVRATNADGDSANTSTASATTFNEPPSRLHLYLLQPEVVFTARVNMASATYPLNEITWDGLIEGAFADIAHGMTLTLGTTQYADDLGRQRIRGDSTPTLLRVGRSSKGTRDGELTANDNAYISVYDDHRVWAKIPYIASDGEIFKDAEIDYSDQTLEPPPVAIAGAGFAATIDPDGVITVAFDGSDSYATADGATITDYGWDLKDGTVIAGSVSTATVTATFPAGFRWINLTVEDSNGKQMTSHRPIFARDPDEDGQPGQCVTYFQIDQHRITSAGQQLSVRIRQDIAAADYPDGTLAMIWEGEPAEPSDRSHMVFIGWHHVDPASIQAERTATLGDVVLQCLDVAGKLETLPGFPQTVERDASPDSWFQMAGMNFDLFMHYLLHWDSTALEVADWYWSGTGDDYELVRRAAEGDSLYDQVERQAMSICPDHHFTCNTLGQLFVNPDPMLQDTGDRTATIQATLDESDWSDLRYTHQRPPRIRRLWGEAIIADDTDVVPIFCVAPGEAPGQGEQESRHGEQLATGQSSLNAVTGHRYARLNAPQGLFNITLAEGNDQGIEPANMTWVRLTISAALAAQRGLAFTNARGLVKEMNIRYGHERGALTRTVDLTWERETSGSAAVTYTPPEAEPVDDGDDWDPPEPDPDLIPPPAPPSGEQVVGMIDSLGNLFKTSNFQSSPPTWSINTSISANFPASNEILSFVVDPFSPGYRDLGTAINGWVATEDGIWRLTDLFGTPTATEIFTFADTAVHSLGQWRTIHASFGRFEADEADNPWIMVASYYNGVPSTPEGTTVVYSQDAGQTWSSEVVVNADFDPDNTLLGLGRYPALWLSPRTPGYALTVAFDADNAVSPSNTSTYKTEDWGATWSIVTQADLLTGNPYIHTNGLMGGCFHVPWADNDDELIVLYGSGSIDSGALNYHLYTSTGVDGGGADLSPGIGSGELWGPQKGLFAVRCYDNDRRYVLLVGRNNDVAGTPDEDQDTAAVFVSNDYGASWDMIYGPLTTAINDRYPVEAAFASDNPNVIFIWESERAVSFTDDFGASVEDKSGNLIALGGAVEVFRGFFGGPT